MRDAQEAMQAMMQTASAGMEPDDPQRSYINEAAQRICRTLGDDFLPYLQYLLPGICNALQVQPHEVENVDAEEEWEEEEDPLLLPVAVAAALSVIIGAFAVYKFRRRNKLVAGVAASSRSLRRGKPAKM